MPTGLYVHLPFCRVRCTYCPFAISTDLTLQDRYVEALVREIGARATGGEAVTIFFGGGTPSRLSVGNLTRVVAQLRRSFAVADDAEFSLEANPEDVNEAAIASWRSLGINRISVGVQSFHDGELRPLGRVHGAELAHEAVARVVDSGLRASLDLILGLPGQTEPSVRSTVRSAIESGVGHLSLYMLDLEEGTALARQVGEGRVTIPDDDRVAALYAEILERLNAAGLHQYEISNFARAGEECRHNLRYWRREPYLGFGNAAHSFDGLRRFANQRDVEAYVEDPLKVEFTESLTTGDAEREVLFLGLRQVAGIDYDDVVRRCGREGIAWMERGLIEGWLQRSGGRVAFTPTGFLLSNEYISQLF